MLFYRDNLKDHGNENRQKNKTIQSVCKTPNKHKKQKTNKKKHVLTTPKEATKRNGAYVKMRPMVTY